MTTLGEKIYRLREQQGLSREEFAQKIGTTRQTVGRWESEAVSPSPFLKNQMIQTFNLPKNYFLNQEVKKNTVSPVSHTQNSKRLLANFLTTWQTYKEDVLILAIAILPIFYIWFIPLSWASTYYSFKHKKRYRLLIFALALAFTSYFLFQLFLFIVVYFGI